MADWPSLLPAPTVSFSGVTDNSLVVTEMESARKRRRRRFTRELRTYKVSWEMTDAQFGMFQSWFLYKISGGADAFNINFPTGGDSLQPVSAAFADGKYSYSHKPVLNWVVSAALEVEEANVWTEEIYDAMAAIGGDIDIFELAAADFHALVHELLPSYF